jgi:hypothetical protein
LSVEAGEGGRLSLRETLVKDDAPPMFGRPELRAMIAGAGGGAGQ